MMKCKKCGTKNGYYRKITNDWLCRKCGEITKIKKQKFGGN